MAPKRMSLHLFLLVLLLMIAILVPAFAQDWPDSLSPDQSLTLTPPPFPVIEYTPEILPLPDISLIEQELQQYRIVYLISDHSLPDDHPIAPNKLMHSIGAHIATDWESFMVLESETPTQFLIIERSALSFVDREWVTSAFIRGVILSMVNIGYEERRELMSLTGPKCPDKPPKTWYPNDFFVNLSFQVVTDNPEDLIKIEQAVRNCENIGGLELEGITSMIITDSNERLDFEYAYLTFLSHMNSQLSNMVELRKDQSLPSPTEVSR